MGKEINPISLLTNDPVKLGIFEKKSRIAMNILAYKESNNLKQSDIADALGVAQSRVSIMLSNPFSIPLEALCTAAIKLGFDWESMVKPVSKG